MNWQIFISTFLLIFLAELGDKTQLAAMARVASEGSARWTIFFAASLALVISTLVAVLLGSALTRIVPERYIRLSAGVLFVLFGFAIMRDALHAGVGDAGDAEMLKPGPVSKFVFRQAMAFEKAAFEDYGRLAKRARDPRLRNLLEAFAREEEAHLSQITTASGRNLQIKMTRDRMQEFRAAGRVKGGLGENDRPMIAQAIVHERSAIRFYSELAHLTPVPSLKKTFRTLAAAEKRHLEQLTEIGVRTNGNTTFSG